MFDILNRMSSDLQHKMYHYEVPPPADAWDKISAELDESHLTDAFPGKLHTAAVTPPPGAWDAIAASLEELQLSHQYPATLYNLEAAPPAGAWDKIKANLETQDEDKPVAPVRRIAPFLRYAAAAVLIAGIAFGATKIFSGNNKTDSEMVATQGEKNTPKQNIPADTQQTNTPGNEQALVQSDEARNDAALEESKHTYAGLNMPNERIKRLGDEYISPASTISAASYITPENTYRDIECSEVNASVFAVGSPMDMASRYVLLMTPDGHMVRVSRKLGELVCCVSGEEQDADCKDNLKKMRQKIASSPVAPSANFTDVLDILHTLRDNNL
jgi:hypothetical protein